MHSGPINKCSGNRGAEPRGATNRRVVTAYLLGALAFGVNAVPVTQEFSNIKCRVELNIDCKKLNNIPDQVKRLGKDTESPFPQGYDTKYYSCSGGVLVHKISNDDKGEKVHIKDGKGFSTGGNVLEYYSFDGQWKKGSVPDSVVRPQSPQCFKTTSNYS